MLSFFRIRVSAYPWMEAMGVRRSWEILLIKFLPEVFHSLKLFNILLNGIGHGVKYRANLVQVVIAFHLDAGSQVSFLKLPDTPNKPIQFFYYKPECQQSHQGRRNKIVMMERMESPMMKLPRTRLAAEAYSWLASTM